MASWIGWLLLAMVTVCGLSVGLLYFPLWIRAMATGTRISMFSLIMMSLRKVSPRVIVDCRIMAMQAGLPKITLQSLEAHILAGGNVVRVTRALIVAHRAGIDLDWNTAVVIDLAGRDILEAVQTSVSPIVIDCPDETFDRRITLDGVAQDGIQLKVCARVTVRMNLQQLVGGATEATIVARVGQGIVSAIGGCATYRQVLCNPQMISSAVLKRGLDDGTAFAIVSIDIASLTVGPNIGAQLALQQAEADMRIALAAAEARRAQALAAYQEMKAREREHQAAVVLSEAEIPVELAAAFRRGQLRAGGGMSEFPQRTRRRPARAR